MSTSEPRRSEVGRETLEVVARDLGGYGHENIAQFLRGDFSCAAPEDVPHLVDAGKRERAELRADVERLRGLLETAVEELDGWRDKGSALMRDELVDDFIVAAKAALQLDSPSTDEAAA